LRLAVIVLTGALAVFGAITMRAALDRREATDSIALDATPLLLTAEELYVALADADAAATTAFLRVGPESLELLEPYDEGIREAGEQLAAIGARDDLSPAARQAVVTIATGLPIYTGYVESARTNRRLGFPLGAAELRRASNLMRDEILPAATDVYKDAGRQLDRAYRDANASETAVAVAVGASVVVVLLLLAQLFVMLRTRRLVNLGLAGATVVVIVLGVTVGGLLIAQRGALATSQQEGSDPLIVLSTVRILALRSLSDVNLDLVERGTESRYRDDFEAVTASIAGEDGSGGLLDRAADSAHDRAARQRIGLITDRYSAYLAVHDEVGALDEGRDYLEAKDLTATRLADAAEEFDRALADEIATASNALDVEAERARRSLRWLPALIAVVVLGAIALANAGLHPRLREYR
jgi:hypothetical protein